MLNMIMNVCVVEAKSSNEQITYSSLIQIIGGNSLNGKLSEEIIDLNGKLSEEIC
jgi:hypothetical protein